MNKENCCFVLVDFQDRLVSVMGDCSDQIKNINILNQASVILNIPLIVTEQYPKGLGKTSSQITLPDNYSLVEKTTFSCFDSDKFVAQLSKLSVDSVILFGLEAHICVLKTALDGLKLNYKVYVVADAISSRTQENKLLAIERMRQSGVFIVSTEMIIFQLLTDSMDPEFKAISALVK